MAFENVNVNKLEKSLEDCLNSINHKSTTNIIANLSSNNVWSTNSRNTLRNSLSKLKDERYIELKNYLTKCLTITEKIKEYKKLEDDYDEYCGNINYYNNKILNLKSMFKFHVVKSNDTLSSISQKYGIYSRAIKIINELGSNNISNKKIIYLVSENNKSKVNDYVDNIIYYEGKLSPIKKDMKTLENQILNMI